MGMSVEDFCRCTPSEFRAVHDGWHEREQSQFRDRWEQVRTLVGCFLPFYQSKKKVTELMPFPWDSEKEKAVPKGGSSPESFREILEKVKGG